MKIFDMNFDSTSSAVYIHSHPRFSSPFITFAVNCASVPSDCSLTLSYVLPLCSREAKICTPNFQICARPGSLAGTWKRSFGD